MGFHSIRDLAVCLFAVTLRATQNDNWAIMCHLTFWTSPSALAHTEGVQIIVLHFLHDLNCLWSFKHGMDTPSCQDQGRRKLWFKLLTSWEGFHLELSWWCSDLARVSYWAQVLVGTCSVVAVKVTSCCYSRVGSLALRPTPNLDDQVSLLVWPHPCSLQSFS